MLRFDFKLARALEHAGGSGGGLFDNPLGRENKGIAEQRLIVAIAFVVALRLCALAYNQPVECTAKLGIVGAGN